MGEKDVSISESSLTAKIKRLIFIQIFHPNDFNTVDKTAASTYKWERHILTKCAEGYES